MAVYGVQVVDDIGQLLQEMLERARVVKQTDAVDPPLHKSDLAGLFERFDSIFSPATSPESKKQIIDAAARTTFYNLLASTTIDSPSYVNIWNLLDIISTLCDDERTEPGLLFWLVEELLDSQTIAGCRKIFDYLESRRGRITAKHFQSKNLIILRSCNELLRRLSRAEDTAFCGRVFIFLFQSFPLGDKSSVNLRGEYHTENITAFDVLPKDTDHEQMGMCSTSEPKLQKKSPHGILKLAFEDSINLSLGATFLKDAKLVDADELYPVFWSLQHYFSQPKKLFDPANFLKFKSGMEATMLMFKSVQKEDIPDRSARSTEDSKRGTKRKRGQGDDELANTFNPKYLTSRDLFDLEISDLSFRRHILVQSLIMLDFMLSLSTKSKEKLAKATIENQNKSVMYTDQVLNEEDTKWTLDMKKFIADYLKQSQDGPFFYRMVETVLSRDKNWARWKIENCPSIARPPISPEEYAEAIASARKATTNKKLRPNPIGSFDLKFLSENDSRYRGLGRLKEPSRYQVPEVTSFKAKIELDDMDIDFAKTDEAKKMATESKASKTWRALRVASASKLAAFDKIERSDKIDDVFKEYVKPEIVNGDDEIEDEEETLALKDKRPIVVSGPRGSDKKNLITRLMKQYSKVIIKKVSHTTREPKPGEVNGQHYYFVTKEEYDIMRDGDEFLEYSNFNGIHYGTSRKIVESIVAQGKVPLMEMDLQGIFQLKQKEYPARFIFLTPSNFSELERRLRERSSEDEDVIQVELELAQQQLEQSHVEGFYDFILLNDDVDVTYQKLINYIFGVEESANGSSPVTPADIMGVSPNVVNADAEMIEAETASKEDGSKQGKPVLKENTSDNPIPDLKKR